MRAIFILHRKGVVLRDTCDYPTISNAYFTMVSEPKLSDDMKGRTKFCILGTKNTPINLSIVDVFNVLVLYYDKSYQQIFLQYLLSHNF